MADRATRPSPPPDDDPYATLGLTRSATEADIKKAYRRLVRTSHPDIHPDDPDAEARFVRIGAAHDLLKDPATRARFDAGEIDASGQERPQRRYYRDFAEAPGGRPDSGGFGGMDPDDIFAEIFRQRSAGGGQGFSARGQDLSYTLEVPFLDAARGGKARIALPGEDPLDVTIPVGLRDGQTLRLRGKGGEGFGGGPRGDALVTVMVRPHPLFRRDGETILITLPITLDEAVLGAKVEVPTINGDIAVTIPKGSSSGRVLRLRGRGVQGRDGTGDQMVELRIVVPKTDDPKLAAFLEEWRKDHHDDPRKAMLNGVPR
ncbi:MAG: DnaJ C-terminal domain-containing protein [bacterium]